MSTPAAPIQSRPPGYNKRVLVLSGKRIPAAIRSRDKKSVYAIHDIIEAYSDLQIIYDDMVFINGKVSDVDGDFCTCVIRYRLLSEIPDELKDTIVVFPNQDADYIYQTITWFSPATRIRLSGVRTLMRTLHFCVRWTASLMKLE